MTDAQLPSPDDIDEAAWNEAVVNRRPRVQVTLAEETPVGRAGDIVSLGASLRELVPEETAHLVSLDVLVVLAARELLDADERLAVEIAEQRVKATARSLAEAEGLTRRRLPTLKVTWMVDPTYDFETGPSWREGVPVVTADHGGCRLRAPTRQDHPTLLLEVACPRCYAWRTTTGDVDSLVALGRARANLEDHPAWQCKVNEAIAGGMTEEEAMTAFGLRAPAEPNPGFRVQA